MLPSTGPGSNLYSSKFPKGGSGMMWRTFIWWSGDLSQVLIMELEHVPGDAELEETLSQPSGISSRNWTDRWAVMLRSVALVGHQTQRSLAPKCPVKQYQLLLPYLSKRPSEHREGIGEWAKEERRTRWKKTEGQKLGISSQPAGALGLSQWGQGWEGEKPGHAFLDLLLVPLSVDGIWAPCPTSTGLSPLGVKVGWNSLTSDPPVSHPASWSWKT